MQTLRKAVVMSVIFVTVLSLSVVAAPSVSAAASAGDLIKMSGLSSVYYLAADGKRYVFPNESTYFSWYKDFSGVVTIPQSELEALPLGANVTVRPGTKLVKITTNPNVYAVEPGGNLRKIVSESQASTLFGANWAKRVIDVSDAFFTNYKIGADLPSNTYPVGSLVKTASGADVYYYDGTNYRKIASESAFNANRFNWNDIVTTTLTVTAGGTAISGAESTLTDTSSGAGGTVYTGGSGLTVALSSDTPAAQSIPSYSTIVPFFSFSLTASNDGGVTVNDITLVRGGTGAASDFDGGYLYVGDTRLTSKRTVSTTDNKVTFSTIGLSVPAGATKVVTLKMNAKTSGTVTGNHNFRINAASDVVTSGATVSGSFPITGNTMTYSSVSAATVVVDGSGNTANKKIGETNVVLGEFTVNNSGSTEDVNIHRVRLKQDGDATVGAVNNLSLEIDGVKVVEGVSMGSDKYVDFVLTTPYLLKKSKLVTVNVRGDVITDIGKTVQLFLNNTADFDARGTAYGNFYGVTVTNQLGSADVAGNNADIITIKGSAINVSFDGPNATDVKKNTTNVNFANFKMKAENEDVNLETLILTLVTSAASSTQTLRNVKIVDSANNVSYGVSSEPAGSGTSENLTFENVYLKKGVQYTFQVKGDIPDQTWSFSGYTYRFDWAVANTVGRYVSSDKLAVATDFSASTLTGQTFTVANPAITFTTVPTNAATYVKSAPKALLFKFTAAANSVSDLKISKLTIATSTGTVLNTMADAFDRVYLYKVASDGAETLMDDETSLTGTTIAFSGFTADVVKGTSNQVTFVVRGDVKSSPTAGTISFILHATAASNYIVRDADSNSLASTQFTISSTASHTSTIATVGTYTAAFDVTEADTNAVKNVLAGSKVLVGRVKLTAQKEPALVKKLTVVNYDGTADNNEAASLEFYKDKAGTQLVGTALFGSDKFAQLDISGTPLEVPVSGATYLYVFANVNGIDYSASPGSGATARANRTFDLTATTTTTYPTKVVGKNTGTDLSNASIGTTRSKAATVMGAVMSGISTSFADAIISSGVKDIFSFKVTAPASTNIDYDGGALGFRLATTTFTVASSVNVTLTSFKIRRVSGGSGEKTCTGSGVLGGGTIAIGFQNCYASTDVDRIVLPNTTAEYIISATVGTSGTAQSMQVTIEDINTNMAYTHNTGTLGTQGADATSVNPNISGVSSVRGGSLKN